MSHVRWQRGIRLKGIGLRAFRLSAIRRHARGGALGYRRCHNWRCDFNISPGKESCPGCGFPTRLWRRVLMHLRILPRGPSLSAAEVEVWRVIDKVQEEWQKLATLQGDLTGYHKPKMTPEQKAAIEKGEEQISRKASPPSSA